LANSLLASLHAEMASYNSFSFFSKAAMALTLASSADLI